MFFPKTCQQRCTLDLINTQCRNRISCFVLNLIYTCLFSKVIEHLVCLHIPAVHWAAGAHNLPTITLMLFPNWYIDCSIQQMSFRSCWKVTYLKYLLIAQNLTCSSSFIQMNLITFTSPLFPSLHFYCCRQARASTLLCLCQRHLQWRANTSLA